MISGAAFMAKARELADQLQGEVNKRFPPPRLAQEAAIEGRTALHAVAMDTVEGDIQISRQRDAWTTQIARLEDIDNRSRDQEYLLRQLRRNVRDLDAAEARRHATPEGLGSQRMRAFGAVGQPSTLAGFFSTVLPLLPYIAVVGIFLSLTGWGSSIWNGWKVDRLENRVERLTEERDAPCLPDELSGDTTRAACISLAHARQQIAEVGAINRQTAATIETERALRARAQREAARIRNEQRRATEHAPSIDYGFGSLRDPGLREGAPAPGGGDTAGGDPG